MGPIRRIIPFALVTALSLATPVLAQVDDVDDFVRLAVLKQNSGGLVQDAIGVLPSSDLGGSLNRISALYHRSAIRSLDWDVLADQTLDPVGRDTPAYHVLVHHGVNLDHRRVMTFIFPSVLMMCPTRESRTFVMSTTSIRSSAS